jgi:hypothetical protein
MGGLFEYLERRASEMPQLGDENAINQRDLRMSFTISVTEAWYLHPRPKTRSASALPCSSGFGDI